MGEDAERSTWPWKWIAVVSLFVATGSIAALVAFLVKPTRVARVTDERLLGTWQSDADRTLAEIRERNPAADIQEVYYRKLFGKLRVTYTPTTYTTELEETTETHKYEVLGKDKHSVVIRDIKDRPSPLDGILELSEFTVIQFDGPDTYWLYSQTGGLVEYFKRVR